MVVFSSSSEQGLRGVTGAVEGEGRRSLSYAGQASQAFLDNRSRVSPPRARRRGTRSEAGARRLRGVHVPLGGLRFAPNSRSGAFTASLELRVAVADQVLLGRWQLVSEYPTVDGVTRTVTGLSPKPPAPYWH